MVDNLLMAVEFVVNQILRRPMDEHNEPINDYLTSFDTTWTLRFLDRFTKDVLIKHLPERLPNVEHFKPILDLVLDMERQFMKLGLCSTPRHRALSHFVLHLSDIHAASKRSLFLDSVRKLLVSDDRSTIQVSEETERGT
jgi:hypothetical protein